MQDGSRTGPATSRAQSHGYKEGQPCDFWKKLGGDWGNESAIREGFITEGSILTRKGLEEIGLVLECAERHEERLRKLEDEAKEAKAILARNGKNNGRSFRLQVSNAYNYTSPTERAKAKIETLVSRFGARLTHFLHDSNGDFQTVVRFPNGGGKTGRVAFSGTLAEVLNAIEQHFGAKKDQHLSSKKL